MQTNHPRVLDMRFFVCQANGETVAARAILSIADVMHFSVP